MADIGAHHTISGSTQARRRTGNSAKQLSAFVSPAPGDLVFRTFSSSDGGVNFPCIGELRLIAAPRSGLSTDDWKR